MKYLIIGDSSTNLSISEQKQYNMKIAPLTIRVDGTEYVDDENLNIKDLVKRLENSKKEAKTSCPSTQEYIDLFTGDYENIFIITLSSKLSGSYNSALLAARMYNEKHPEVKIHVFDSRAAASSQYLIAFKLHELSEQGLSFEEIVKKTDTYIDNIQLLFILDKLDNLEKNGRISFIKLKIAQLLNLKLILKQTKEGTIDLSDKARGPKKAISKMVKSMETFKEINSDTKVVIFHCEALERAEAVKKIIEKYHTSIKDIKIIAMKGLNSTYAEKGGIIMTF